MSATKKIPDSELKPTVGDSLVLYQTTVAFGAILMGFVFAALLLLLCVDGELSLRQKWAVHLLVFSKLSLMASLLMFHMTVNQIIRYWKIFIPISSALSLAIILFEAGVVFMLWSIAALLCDRQLYCLSFIEFVIGVCLILITVAIGGEHNKEAPYVRRVDAESRQCCRIRRVLRFFSFGFYRG